MKGRSKANIDKHAKLVRQLIEHHYKKKALTITPLSGGLTNFVFGVSAGKEELVVRMSEEREKINFFLKEQWAVARAKEKGIPVPEILEVGNDIIPIPYMIMRKIDGEEATHHPDRWEIVKEMGRLAAIIHTIPTKGFGHMFDWSQNTLSKNQSWKDYLECELKVDERLTILRKHKMLPAKTFRRLSIELAKMRNWKGSPCLHHGDLRLKNVMTDKKGKIVSLIDWDNCTSQLPPYWDLSIALHDLSVDAQWKFLEGYGIEDKHLPDIAPGLKVLNILNYAPVVEQLAREKQKTTLAHYRIRLHGALDMYSL
jgi:aminoglycoside phosphotransferase (APT) family kinase protein